MSEIIPPLFLKTFRKAYEVKSYTKAAQALNMTQSGVSQHIAALEKIFAVRLFEKSGREVRPSRAADKLYATGGDWLSSMGDLIDELRNNQNEFRGRIVFGAPGSFAQYILPTLLTWKKSHPDLYLDFVYGPNSVMAEEILSGRMDLGVTTDLLDPKEFINEEVFEQEYVLVSHPDLEVQTENWESFCQNTFITYPGAESIFQRWISVNFKHGIGKTHQLNLKYKINNMEGNLLLLLQKAGVTIYPSEPLLNLVKQKKLKIHRLQKKVTNQVYLVRRQGHILSRKLASLRDHIFSATEM